jgi:hypothetical protein
MRGWSTAPPKIMTRMDASGPCGLMVRTMDAEVGYGRTRAPFSQVGAPAERNNPPCRAVPLRDLDFMGIVTPRDSRAAGRSSRPAACVNPEQQEAHL